MENLIAAVMLECIYQQGKDDPELTRKKKNRRSHLINALVCGQLGQMISMKKAVAVAKQVLLEIEEDYPEEFGFDDRPDYLN